MKLHDALTGRYWMLPYLMADDGAGSGGADQEDQKTDDSKKDDQKDDDQKKDNQKKDDQKDEKKYSDKDVDSIIEKKFAKWQEQQDAKIAEAEKLAKMNEKEKTEHKLSETEKKLKALEDEKTLNEMAKEARKMLSEKKLNIGDDLLYKIIDIDAEKTKANVDDFIKAFDAAVEAQVKEALKGKTPKTSAGDNGKPKNMTPGESIVDKTTEFVNSQKGD